MKFLSKFSPEKSEFESLMLKMSYRELAKYYGVAKSTIANYIKRSAIDYERKPVCENIFSPNINEFRALVEKKMTYNELSKYYQVPVGTIKYFMTKNHVKIKKSRVIDKFDPDINELKKLFEKDLTVTQVAEYYNVSSSTVSMFIRRKNIIPKSLGKEKYHPTKQQIIFIKELLDQGAPVYYISALLNVNRFPIDRIIKENNLKRNQDVIFIATPAGIAKFKKDNKHLSLSEINILYEKELNKIVQKSKQYIFTKDNPYYNDRYKKAQISYKEKEYIIKSLHTKTIYEILDELSISPPNLHYFMVQNGLFNPFGKRRKKMPTDKKFEKMINDKHTSNNEIAKVFGVSSSCVARWRKELFGTNFRFSQNLTKMTSAEKIFAEILEKNNIPYFFQYKIEHWKIDFYLGFNVCVEIQGDYWHSINAVKETDKKKKDFLSKNNFKLIAIFENDLKKNFDSTEKNFLKKYLGSICQEIDRIKDRVNASQSGVENNLG